MHFSLLFRIVFLCILSHSTHAITKSKVCPVLGPSFPQPSDLSCSDVFRTAVKSLNQQINVALQNGTVPGESFAPKPFKHQTFSLSLFSSHDEGLLWQRHHTDSSVATSPVGTHHVDADTVYRIGSVSKLLTMYVLLMVDGDQSYNRPVTHYIPQLAGVQPKVSYGILPQWDQITVGDLATHLGGIVADYGLDDEEYGYPTKGFPPLAKDRLPTCNYQIGPKVFTCTQEELLRGAASQPAIYAAGITPSYSNLGYDLIGVVAESIAGIPMAQLFKEKLVKPLNLKRTFYGVPSNKSYGAIPVNVARSGWVQKLGPSNADGGNTVSTNDLATVGKSIMNSTLLPQSVTRRWIKPRTFTSDPTNFIGAPWEIYRWDTPTRLFDIYTKEGGEGQYSTMFALVPDLDFGFTVMITGAEYRPDIEEELANIIAEAMLPAVEETARQQAHSIYAGRYASNEINSSVTITTDSQPGLKITEWVSNGTDVMPELAGSNADFRLWPNELYTGDRVGFTASWEPLLPNRQKKIKPLRLNCLTWVDTGFTQYGNVAVGSFVFDLDENKKIASRLVLPALDAVLEKRK